MPAERSPTARNVTRKLSDRQRLARAAFDECPAAKGTPAPTELQLPARTIVVQLNAWREELYRKGVLDRDAKSPREEFKRVRQQLQARSLIGVNGVEGVKRAKGSIKRTKAETVPHHRLRRGTWVRPQ
jgi:hypothetical protein